MTSDDSINATARNVDTRDLESRYQKRGPGELTTLKQLVADIMILGLTDPEAVEYINRRHPHNISLTYYKKMKGRLKEDSHLQEKINFHKKTGYIAAYFNALEDLRFTKNRLARALENKVEDPESDGREIAALGSAMDSVVKTFVAVSMGSPFLDMLIDDIIARKIPLSGDAVSEQAEQKQDDNDLINRAPIPHFIEKDVRKVEDTASSVLGATGGGRDSERVDDPSPQDSETLQGERDVPLDSFLPQSSLVVPKDEPTSGDENAGQAGENTESDGGRARGTGTGTDSKGHPLYGSGSDSSGEDSPERVFN